MNIPDQVIDVILVLIVLPPIHFQMPAHLKIQDK
jgi:hypothetical protein